LTVETLDQSWWSYSVLTDLLLVVTVDADLPLALFFTVLYLLQSMYVSFKTFRTSNHHRQKGVWVKCGPAGVRV